MLPYQIALYGNNGHQVTALLNANPRATLRAYAELEISQADFPQAQACASLDEILRIPEIDLVVLCSPCRADQPRDTLRALAAGKHVYAEKPAAFTNEELDEILRAAATHQRLFHSMSGTAFGQPYLAMRQEIAAGAVGEIVQVHVRKSYPWHNDRPLDAAIDGGLLLWVGVHATRMAEHVCGLRLRNGAAVQRALEPPTRAESTPAGAATALAVSVLAELTNGAPVTMAINLLNCRGTGVWGYEELQIFGREGFLESLNGGSICRKIRYDGEYQTVDQSEPSVEFFTAFLDELDGGKFPLSLEEEFSPERFLYSLL